MGSPLIFLAIAATAGNLGSARTLNADSAWADWPWGARGVARATSRERTRSLRSGHVSFGGLAQLAAREGRFFQALQQRSSGVGITLPLFVRWRACRNLCNTIAHALEEARACNTDCKIRVNTWKPAATSSGHGIHGSAEYYADGPCLPILDVNAVGFPSFFELDISEDDAIEFQELSLYGFLLCVPQAAISDMFFTLDKNDDGVVTPDEWNSFALGVESDSETSEPTTTTTTTTLHEDEYLMDVLHHLTMDPPKFESVDLNGDGSLQAWEFTNIFMQMLYSEDPHMDVASRGKLHRALVEEIFPLLDTNYDLVISRAEYSAASGQVQDELEGLEANSTAAH